MGQQSDQELAQIKRNKMLYQLELARLERLAGLISTCLGEAFEAALRDTELSDEQRGRLHESASLAAQHIISGWVARIQKLGGGEECNATTSTTRRDVERALLDACREQLGLGRKALEPIIRSFGKRLWAATSRSN